MGEENEKCLYRSESVERLGNWDPRNGHAPTNAINNAQASSYIRALGGSGAGYRRRVPEPIGRAPEAEHPTSSYTEVSAVKYGASRWRHTVLDTVYTSTVYCISYSIY